MENLQEFKKNSYSQFVEDGIIQEILKRISSNVSLNQWCCEFGAWDGLHLSNTARLIKEDNYRAVLIEGDQRRMEDLEFNFPSSQVIKIATFITTSGITSLDNILASTDIPKDFDFLSIDIDGMDYWIFKSLASYRPKVICIEFNPTIPNAVNFVQVNDQRVKHGSSAKAIESLGGEKDYGVVAATECNLFLVRNDLINFVLPHRPSLESIIPLGNDPQYLFSGYDGSVLSNKSEVRLGWHGTFSLEVLEILPPNLRKYSGDYGKMQHFMFRVFYFLHRQNRLRLLLKKFLSTFASKKT
jgi:hypothetical protein